MAEEAQSIAVVNYLDEINSSSRRERAMKRYVEGENRSQSTLFPASLDDYTADDNLVRVVDVFIDELDLRELDFEGAEPEATGRPSPPNTYFLGSSLVHAATA